MVSVILALLSFFVIVRQLSFIGVGIAHSAFGGVALGVLLGVSPTMTAVVFALIMANAISWFTRNGRLKSDSIIGIFFSLSMALGVIFIGLSKDYNVDLFGYLFGNILAITPGDQWLIIGLGGAICLIIGALFKELLFASFDSEVAWVSGIPVGFLDHLLLSLIALAVVISIKIIGIILVSALLVIPGAAAFQVSDRYGKIVLLSVLLAAASVFFGLLVSTYLNVASGATIVVFAGALFLMMYLIGAARRKWFVHLDVNGADDKNSEGQ